MTEDLFAKLSNKIRKVLQEALMPNERVHAVINGRENQAIALTGFRLVLVNGSLLFRGDDAIQLADVARITSGVSAMSISMRHGADYIFNFWPTSRNRADAKEFVRATRELQARSQSIPVSGGPVPEQSIADQLTKFDQLRQQGVLTDAEFEAQKAKLLGG